MHEQLMRGLFEKTTWEDLRGFITRYDVVPVSGVMYEAKIYDDVISVRYKEHWYDFTRSDYRTYRIIQGVSTAVTFASLVAAGYLLGKTLLGQEES